MTDETKYHYDVFISYRRVDPDQGWVHNQLRPALQNAGLKVFVDATDFVPGRDLMQEMRRASTESRRGICVLSPDYFADSAQMAAFEWLMLRRFDPTGRDSRLIPIILRETKLPEEIRGLVPVDWTHSANHAQEWTRLLDVLGAKNREGPKPAQLETDGESSPPIRIVTPRPRIPTVRLVVIAAIAMTAILAVVGYRNCGSSGSRTVEGRVYYQQASGNSALIPVKNVVVFFSQKPDLKSAPTDSDGRFIIQGIPASVPIHLTAKYGTQDFEMGYQEAGDYRVIPPPDEIKDITFIDTAWVDAPTEPCLPDDGQVVANFKVYSLMVDLPANQARTEAVLTVDLLGSPGATIRSAHVLSTPKNLYRNDTRPGEDRAKSHTWVFQLPASGLKTKLGVCLGAEQPGAKLSKENLKTHYKLR